MSEYEGTKIDWSRVRCISVHLKDWMAKHNYETTDIERAIVYTKAPGHIRRMGGTQT